MMGSRMTGFQPEKRILKMDEFEIGRILHLKSEIRNLRLDSQPDPTVMRQSNLRFRISDLRCRTRPISKFRCCKALFSTVGEVYDYDRPYSWATPHLARPVYPCAIIGIVKISSYVRSFATP
jgi:hypothetical protein